MIGHRTIIIITAAGLLFVGASMLSGRKASTTKSSLPVTQPAATEANEEWIDSIDLAVDEGRPKDLAKLFQVPHLPSTAKAHLIDAAMEEEDGVLNAEAGRLLREMVERGPLSDVLAALPKATHFSSETVQEIARLQESLCRFQGADNELGFEMIKSKFNLVFKNQAEIKPWPAVCRQG